ncbi:Conserved_hypothetical protein [Hexamita inflata]|uniref:Uncharacterized protein n=1 Tax=Hexamita inflata TaxID=28002 RepID=A0AA86TUI6_9EUKA|nr:Conserved hypothetical protein [Hexamita inflata]
MNANEFTQALFEYLSARGLQIACDAQQVHDALEAMNATERRGIWEFVGKQLRVNPSTAHNYYHNTWSMQFFDNIQPYRDVLKQMVARNMKLSNSEIVQKFLSAFPEKNFLKHTVQQIVSIQKLRNSKKENSLTTPSESQCNVSSFQSSFEDNWYSVDISQCVRFLDAVSM